MIRDDMRLNDSITTNFEFNYEHNEKINSKEF